MRRVLSLSAVLLLLWVGLCLAATEVICIVDTDSTQNPDYTSLAAAIAGETGASPKCVTSADLVTNDEQLTIECRATSGAADTTAVTISGFTTDADNFVKIYVPSGHRHAGKWDANKYRIAITTESSSIQIMLSGYLVIDGLQIATTEYNSDSKYGIANNVAHHVTIKNCIIRCGNPTYAHMGIWFGAGSANQSLLYNCIAYGFTNGRGYFLNGDNGTRYSTYCFNLIAYGCGSRGFGGESATYINCAAINCTDGFNAWGSAHDYNVSDVSGDDCLGDHGFVTEQSPTEIFVDPENGDFRLVSGSDLIDAGIGPALDSNVPTTDIVGTSRSGNTCDIGAFEYVAGPKWNGITPAKWNGIDWSNLKWNGM